MGKGPWSPAGLLGHQPGAAETSSAVRWEPGHSHAVLALQYLKNELPPPAGLYAVTFRRGSLPATFQMLYKVK